MKIKITNKESGYVIEIQDKKGNYHPISDYFVLKNEGSIEIPIHEL